MSRVCCNTIAGFCLAALAGPVLATVVWNEAINGDLSNSWGGPTSPPPGSPTSLSVSLGSNQVFGSTGRSTTGVIDRDYFTITVPADRFLVAIEVLDGTQSDTNDVPVSFIGLSAGPIGGDPTITPNSALALTLLGYYLYGPADIGKDILAGMDANSLTPPAGGFTAPLPLGAGTYTFWIQETVAGNFNYGFDLKVVPEPESLPLLALGLAGLFYFRRKDLAAVME